MQQLLAALIPAFLAVERRWTGDAAQGKSTSLRPHLAPELAPRSFLNPVVCTLETRKPRDLRGFRPIAGAGFEPATFGL